MFPQFPGIKQGYLQPPRILMDIILDLPRLKLKSEESEEDDLSLRPSSPNDLPSPPGPFVDYAPSRRKVVWIWFCCHCGHGGMKVGVDPCTSCGLPRCPNCDTQRYYFRRPERREHL